MPKPTTSRRLVAVVSQAIRAHQAYTAQRDAFEASPMYSTEGNAQRKREWDAAARADYEATQNQLREQLDREAECIRDAAAQHRPQIDVNNPADLTRTAQAWQFTVLPRLERGETIGQIASTVGADALLSIERFGPDYLSGQRGGSGIGARHVDATPDVRQVVNRQFMDLATTEDAKRALDEYNNLDHDLAGFDEVSAQLRAGNGLGAALYVGMLERGVSTGVDSADEGAE